MNSQLKGSLSLSLSKKHELYLDNVVELNGVSFNIDFFQAVNHNSFSEFSKGKQISYQT